MLILIKNILNVIGKGNKRNYQINNDDLGKKKIFAKGHVYISRKEN